MPLLLDGQTKNLKKKIGSWLPFMVIPQRSVGTFSEEISVDFLEMHGYCF